MGGPSQKAGGSLKDFCSFSVSLSLASSIYGFPFPFYGVSWRDSARAASFCSSLLTDPRTTLQAGDMVQNSRVDVRSGVGGLVYRVEYMS